MFPEEHTPQPESPERLFKLIYPHATINLRGDGDDGFALMVDNQRSDTDEPQTTAENAPAPSGHAHDFVELVYVRSGSGLHWHNTLRHSVYAGDCYVILPGDEHTYRSTSKLWITNVLFYPEILEPYRETLLACPGFRRFFTTEPLFREESSFRHKLHFSLSNQQRMTVLLDELEREQRERGDAYQVTCAGLFMQIVVLLSRAFDRTFETGNVRRQFEGKDDLVSAAIAYLEKNYTADMRVEDIARSVFISPSRLSHVFKETTGISLFDYLTRTRIDRACRLLTETDQSITSIAFSLGYHDAAYFTRLFSKNTGLSPSAYRKNCRSMIDE
ncbi:MAG: helix-turn-helix domain-containing protein [Chitinivibrionales bacterium]|nr:helix-turn-helix domain-containing protein [Chitinivibrionales bacterium]